MYVSNALAHAVAAAVRWHGPAATERARRSVVTPESLADPTGLLPVAEFERLVEHAYDVSGDPALGLRIGESTPVAMLHVVGHVVTGCHTLRDAFRAFVRFVPVIDQAGRYELVEGADVARFEFTATAGSERLRRFRAEVCLGFTVRLARQLLAATGPADQIDFAHPAPRYVRDYEALFRCPVRFDQRTNGIAFCRDLLDSPLLGSDPELADTLRARAEALLCRSEPSLPEQLDYLLRSAATLDDLSEHVVARRMGISARTLRRRLSGCARSFSQMLDAVRRDRALTALAARDVCVKAIAEDLGFSEPSALHRAFKRWTKTTIGDYRRGLDAPTR